MELSGFGALGTWRKRVSRAPLTAEEALKHLLLSVDVDTLYRCLTCCNSYIPVIRGPAFVFELSVRSMINVKLQKGLVACHGKSCLRGVMAELFGISSWQRTSCSYPAQECIVRLAASLHACAQPW